MFLNCKLHSKKKPQLQTDEPLMSLLRKLAGFKLKPSMTNWSDVKATKVNERCTFTFQEYFHVLKVLKEESTDGEFVAALIYFYTATPDMESTLAEHFAKSIV